MKDFASFIGYLKFEDKSHSLANKIISKKFEDKSLSLANKIISKYREAFKTELAEEMSKRENYDRSLE